ncbi:hypothetical protein LINPERHAP1_LOCUS3662 [Linum perenne]
MGAENASNICSEVSTKEFKDAMFSISGDKSPGLDGFGSSFFKHSWHLVGEDVCLAVKQFFETGKLHRSSRSLNDKSFEPGQSSHRTLHVHDLKQQKKLETK